MGRGALSAVVVAIACPAGGLLLPPPGPIPAQITFERVRAELRAAEADVKRAQGEAATQAEQVRLQQANLGELFAGPRGRAVHGSKPAKKTAVSDEILEMEKKLAALVRDVPDEEATVKTKIWKMGRELCKKKGWPPTEECDKFRTPGDVTNNTDATANASDNATSAPAPPPNATAPAPAAAREPGAWAPAPSRMDLEVTEAVPAQTEPVPALSPGSAILSTVPLPYQASAPAPVIAASPASPEASVTRNTFGTMNETLRLPAQGFDEFGGDSELVGHTNMMTATSDWQSEWPRSNMTHKEAITKTCEEQPVMSIYCKLWLRDHANEKGGPPAQQGASERIGEEGWFNKKVVEPAAFHDL